MCILHEYLLNIRVSFPCIVMMRCFLPEKATMDSH